LTKITKYERKVIKKGPANVLDKIRLWYMQDDAHMLAHDEPIVLTDREEEMRKRYIQIFGLLTDGKTESQVVEFLSKEYSIGDRWARQMIANSKTLFCDISAVNKEAMRIMQIELRKKAIQEIKEDDTLESDQKWYLIDRFEKRIEEIAQLTKDDTINFRDLVKALELPDIQRTSNPDILDIPHEDVEE
jgi:hypothetical protein